MKRIVFPGMIFLIVSLLVFGIVPKAKAATMPIQDPGFEVSGLPAWTYSETDGSYNHSRSSAWKMEGKYSLKVNSTALINSGAYAQMAQAVDFGIIDTIIFDANLWAERNGDFTASVLVGSTVVWSKAIATVAAVYLNQKIDVSAFSGSQSLIFRISADIETNFNETNYFDNIRTLSSFHDLVYSAKDNDFGAGETTVYMYGEGFNPATTYRVVFWDEVGASWVNRQTDDKAPNSSGELTVQRIFVPGIDTEGTWWVAVYDSVTYTPATYDPADGYLIIADSFVAQASAVPEMPTILGGIAVFGLICLFYWRIRRGRHV